MTTGNAASATVSNAGVAPPPPDTPCEELQKRNQTLRRSLARDKRSRSIRQNFGANGATTVAHGSLNGGGAVGATSRLLPSRYDNRVVKGLWAEPNKKKRSARIKARSSNLCPDPPFEYDSAFRPHQSHCESKMLEHLYNPKNGGPVSGSLLLNINWQSQADPNSKQPCQACRRLLCHAQQECDPGLVISLCQKDPKKPPKPLRCPPKS